MAGAAPVVDQPPKSWQLTAVLWYTFYFGSQVVVSPFLRPYYVAQGLQNRQIGLISAFTPWVALPASFAWGALADMLHAHKAIMLTCFVVAVCMRCMVLTVHSFAGFLAVSLLTEVFKSPTGIMADAAVVSRCPEGTYGQYRKWGAVGWGVMSSVGGALLDARGLAAALVLHVCLAAPCLGFGWVLHAAQKPKEGAAVAGAGRAGSSRASGVRRGRGSKMKSPRKRLEPVPEVDEEEEEESDEGEGSYDEADTSPAGEEEEQAAGSKGLRAGDEEAQLLPHRSQHSHHQKHKHKGHKHKKSVELLSLNSSSRQGSSSSISSTGSDSSDSSSSNSSWSQSSSSRGSRGSSSSAVAAGKQQGLGSEHGLGEGGGGDSQALTFKQKFQQLLSNAEVSLFLCIAVLMGFGFGTIDSFLFVFLKELGATAFLMGLTLSVTCAAEVPVFQVQPWLLQRFSTDRLLDFVIFVYALRMLCYSVLPAWGTPWAVLPVEVLHGITFGLGWGTGTTRVRKLAPAGLTATLQGLFQGCYFGLGYGLGALCGGFVSQKTGFPTMFVIHACAIMICWAIARSGSATLQRALATYRSVRDRHAGPQYQSLPS